MHMDDFDAKLAELFANFRRQLPNRLSTCMAAWESYSANDDSDALSQLRFQSHKLAGAASIYGFEEIGDSARNIELLVDQFYAGSLDNKQTFQQQLAPHIQLLKKLVLEVEQDTI